MIKVLNLKFLKFDSKIYKNYPCGLSIAGSSFLCPRTWVHGYLTAVNKSLKQAEFRYSFTSPQFRMKQRFNNRFGGYLFATVGQTHFNVLKFNHNLIYSRVRDYRRKLQIRYAKQTSIHTIVTAFHKFKSLLPYKIKGIFIKKQVKYFKKYIRSGKRAR
jgi:hypothetical protein